MAPDDQSSQVSTAEFIVLRDLEEELLRPEVRKSTDRLDQLLADEFTEFGSSGRIFDKRQIIDALQREAPFHSSLADFSVRRLAPGVMLVTYRATDTERPDSRIRSSIWKLVDGRWQMVFHQGTPSRGQD